MMNRYEFAMLVVVLVVCILLGRFAFLYFGWLGAAVAFFLTPLLLMKLSIAAARYLDKKK